MNWLLLIADELSADPSYFIISKQIIFESVKILKLTKAKKKGWMKKMQFFRSVWHQLLIIILNPKNDQWIKNYH